MSIYSDVSQIAVVWPCQGEGGVKYIFYDPGFFCSYYSIDPRSLSSWLQTALSVGNTSKMTMHSSVLNERYVRWFVFPTKSCNRSLFKHTMKWSTNDLHLLPCPLYVRIQLGFSSVFTCTLFRRFWGFFQLNLSNAVAMFLTMPWPQDKLNLSQGNRVDFCTLDLSQSSLKVSELIIK